MKDIVVVGGEKFVLGFQIAGIEKSFKLAEEAPEQSVRELMNNPDIGLIIMQDKALRRLNDEYKEIVTQSVQPVFLIMSNEGSNDELRRMIKKSIGVDVFDK